MTSLKGFLEARALLVLPSPNPPEVDPSTGNRLLVLQMGEAPDTRI